MRKKEENIRAVSPSSNAQKTHSQKGKIGAKKTSGGEGGEKERRPKINLV